MSGTEGGRDAASFAAVHEQSMRRAESPTSSSWPPESALTADELEAFFEVNRYAVLATTRADGRPHAAPIGFVVRDGRIWMASVAGAVRLRNLEHRPRASLVVFRGEGDDHVAVTVEGSVVLHDRDADAAAWLRDAWHDRFGTVLDWHGTVIELIPERVLSYGRGRVGRP